ncbi:MAG: hypothetical protein HS115_11200 [Spirochaetales bacterium]|nr:hypothetical protein [Spirochaetales bacterium]
MSDDLQKYLLEPELGGPDSGSADLTMHRILNRNLEETLGGLARRTERQFSGKLSEKEFKSRLLAGIASTGPFNAEDARFFESLEGGSLTFLRRPSVLYAAAALLVALAYPVYWMLQPGQPEETLAQAKTESQSVSAPTIEPSEAPALPPARKTPAATRPQVALAPAVPSAPSRPQGSAREEKVASDGPEKASVAASDNVEAEKPAAEAKEEGLVAMRSRAMPAPDAPAKKGPNESATEATEKRLLEAYRKAPDPAGKALARKALEEFYRRSGQETKIKNL